MTLVLPMRRWTLEEYYRAAEVGVIGPDERLELIDDQILLKPRPMSGAHAICVTLSSYAWRGAVGEACFVMDSKPVELPGANEPEPDVSIVRGKPRDFTNHPKAQDLLLVMEVSDAATEFDTGYKASLYAWAGIPEFWVLDLNSRVLEVKRDPNPFSDTYFGYDYRENIRYTEGEFVTASTVPSAPISVGQLLPEGRAKSA